MFIADDIKSLAFIGSPSLFDDICFIYPLTVGTVLALQNSHKYDIYLRILTIDRFYIRELAKEKGIELLETREPFDFLVDSAQLDSIFLLELQDAFRTFIKEEITITFEPKQIIVGDITERRVLNQENFEEFQNILRLQNNIAVVNPIPKDESEKVRKFREKQELRDAVKKKQNSASAPEFSVLLSALCAYGVGITPFNVKDLSIYAFYSLFGISNSREKFDIDMNYLYAGVSPKKLNPKHWISK